MNRASALTDRAALGEEAATVFDAIASSRGVVHGPLAVLLHRPELARAVLDLGTIVRFESMLPVDVRETAMAATARAHDCRYEWQTHARLAREAGVETELLATVADGLPPTGDDARAVAARFAHALATTHSADDALYKSAKAHWDDPQLVELVSIVGYFGLMCLLVNAFELSPGGSFSVPA